MANNSAYSVTRRWTRPMRWNTKRGRAELGFQTRKQNIALSFSAWLKLDGRVTAHSTLYRQSSRTIRADNGRLDKLDNTPYTRHKPTPEKPINSPSTHFNNRPMMSSSTRTANAVFFISFKIFYIGLLTILKTKVVTRNLFRAEGLCFL